MRGARHGSRKNNSNASRDTNRAPDIGVRKNNNNNNKQSSTTIHRATNNKNSANDKIKPTTEKSDDSNQYCDICAQLVPGPERDKIFAFGRCDHHVCYVCSTRLRVICDQTDCPICRDKLEKVIFSNVKDRLFSDIDLSKFLFNESYKIYFENETIKRAFDKLLRFECLECVRRFKKSSSTSGKSQDDSQLAKKDVSDLKITSPTSKQQSQKKDALKSKENSASISNMATTSIKSGTNGTINEDSSGLLDESDVPKGALFPDVLSLKNHLNYVHKLKLCDLCLTHNKLFPYEYSYYDASGLWKHMKEGEPNTSHRGHPDCQLCHDTFFNMDELLIHMSREHFHCHICARQDTNLRYYFMDYTSLREHFKNKHFLCERGNCRVEQFTSAFENNIEYQFHVVNVHGNPSSSRGESRLQRTITLEPTPHRGGSNSSPSRIHHQSSRQDQNVAIVTTGQMATANNPTTQRPPENILSQLRQQRLPSRNEFPALGQGSGMGIDSSIAILPISNTAGHQMSQSIRTSRISNVTTDTSSFPAMPPPSTSTSSSSVQQNSFVRTLGGGIRRPETLNQSDFPPLPLQPKPKAAKKKSTSKKNVVPTSDMTLEELIRNSLVIGSNSSRSDKGPKGKNGKPVKQKPVKIQLS